MNLADIPSRLVCWVRENEVRHCNRTKHSKPLAKRGYDNDYGYHLPLDPHGIYGDRVALLFGFVLSHINVAGYMQRTGRPTLPRASQDVREFHKNQFTKFLEANPDWDQYAPAEMIGRLEAFLFKLFTTDRRQQCMRPLDPKQRRLCQASWGEFTNQSYMLLWKARSSSIKRSAILCKVDIIVPCGVAPIGSLSNTQSSRQSCSKGVLSLMVVLVCCVVEQIF